MFQQKKEENSPFFLIRKKLFTVFDNIDKIKTKQKQNC